MSVMFHVVGRDALGAPQPWFFVHMGRTMCIENASFHDSAGHKRSDDTARRGVAPYNMETQRTLRNFAYFACFIAVYETAMIEIHVRL